MPDVSLSTPLNTENPSNRVRMIDVQGVPVLALDFSHASPQQTLAILDQFQQVLKGAQADSVRVLSEVEGLTYDAGVSSKWKAVRMEYDPYIRASAVVGASSFLSVAVESYTTLMSWLKLPRAKQKIRQFKTRDLALAWLIKT